MAKPTIVEFVQDKQMLGLSISPAQRTCLKAIYGLALTPEEVDLFKQCTGRKVYTPREYGECTVIAGARSGKDSRLAAPIVLYEAIFGGHDLKAAKGETPIVALVAQDARAVQIAFGYIKDYLLHSPMLKSLLDGEPLSTSLKLTNGVTIMCFPSTLRSMRGYSICCACMDELAYFALEGQADSDKAIEDSITRGMVNFTNPKLIKISTPWLKSGVLYRDYNDGFGKDSADILVWQASSQLMNPSMSTTILSRARRRDSAMYDREFGALFVDDLQSFLPQPWIDAADMKGTFGITPVASLDYIGVIDAMSGGSDTFTFSAGHLSADGVIIQDALKGWDRPRHGTLDLEQTVVADIAKICRQYRITTLVADRHAKDWVAQAFARHGINVIHDDSIDSITVPSKSECYEELEVAPSQGQVRFLDHPDLLRQLKFLEKSPVGRCSSIIHVVPTMTTRTRSRSWST